MNLGPQKQPSSFGRLVASLRQFSKLMHEVDPSKDTVLAYCPQCQGELYIKFMRLRQKQSKMVKCACGKTFRVTCDGE